MPTRRDLAMPVLSVPVLKGLRREGDQVCLPGGAPCREAKRGESDSAHPDRAGIRRKGTPVAELATDSGRHVNLTELAAQVQGRVLSARSLSEAALVRLQDAGPLNAVAWCVPDAARVQADAVDRLCSMEKDAGPLAGGARRGQGQYRGGGHAHGLRQRFVGGGYLAPSTARAVYLLQNAGAVLFCGANMDELAIGTTGTNSVHGAHRQPQPPGPRPWWLQLRFGGPCRCRCCSIGAGHGQRRLCTSARRLVWCCWCCGYPGDASAAAV